MAKKATDVKAQAAAPSAAPTSASAVAASDVKPSVAPAAADTQATPSAPEQRPLLDVVRESLAKKAEASATEPEAAVEPEAPEEPEAAEPAAEPEPTDQNETPEEPASEEAATDDEDSDKGPIPYSRFAEVNAAKVKLERQFAEFQPVLQAYDQIAGFCSAQGLSPEDFQNALHLAAALKNDPERALEYLAPQVEQLQTLTGAQLPPDLAKAVQEGEITPEMAARLAKAEGQKKLAKSQAERAQRQAQEQQSRQATQAVTQSVAQWLKEVQTKDPDFKPKPAGAPNGPFELFQALYEQTLRNAEVKSPEDYVQAATRVYSEVRRSLKTFTPRLSTPARPRSNSSSTPVSNNEPKNAREAIAMRLKSRGISFPVNGTS